LQPRDKATSRQNKNQSTTDPSYLQWQEQLEEALSNPSTRRSDRYPAAQSRGQQTAHYNTELNIGVLRLTKGGWKRAPSIVTVHASAVNRQLYID
jgi:hypothetical protein